MTQSLIDQVNEFIPAMDKSMTSINGKMSEVMAFLARLPIPASVINPWVDKYNGEVSRFNDKQAEVTSGLTNPTMMCYTLMTIREAADYWTGTITPTNAQPVAESLVKENLQGDAAFSWRSAAVDDYWNYIARDHETAKALVQLSTDIGRSLTALADAIDEQNSALAWAIVGTIGSFLGTVASAIGLGCAIGAIAGLPAGGVGAIPGALIGGLIGAIVGLVGGLIGLAASIHAWVDATHIISDEGAAQLTEIETAAKTAANDPWPAPYEFCEGSEFRK